MYNEFTPRRIELAIEFNEMKHNVDMKLNDLNNKIDGIRRKVNNSIYKWKEYERKVAGKLSKIEANHNQNFTDIKINWLY
jgi:hypothetical protein